MSQPNGDSIPNLWPSERIKVSVLSPAAILKTQAGLLSSLTKGLLIGEVSSAERDADGQILVDHHFDIIAPALGGYRRRILRVCHNADEVYPVTVVNELDGQCTEAKNQDEFQDSIRGIFGSDQLLTTVHSLIARSNDVQLIEEAA